MNSTIFIAFGSNLPSSLGSSRATIEAAILSLEAEDIQPEQVSPFYETPAYPDPSDPPFINGVLSAKTDRQPADVMSVLLALEEGYGRVRERRWAPRSLDLDLINYEGRVLPSDAAWQAAASNRGDTTPDAQLVIPHPRMHHRQFVLQPLADIAADWLHPVFQKTAIDLLTGVEKMPLVQIDSNNAAIKALQAAGQSL